MMVRWMAITATHITSSKKAGEVGEMRLNKACCFMLTMNNDVNYPQSRSKERNGVVESSLLEDLENTNLSIAYYG